MAYRLTDIKNSGRTGNILMRPELYMGLYLQGATAVAADNKCIRAYYKHDASAKYSPFAVRGCKDARPESADALRVCTDSEPERRTLASQCGNMSHRYEIFCKTTFACFLVQRRKVLAGLLHHLYHTVVRHAVHTVGERRVDVGI